jgi:acetylglutamate/LysW-gamma-L-alpha-aminoadipate kinase
MSFAPFELVKVGGSCIVKDPAAAAAAVSAGDKVVVVHGYGASARRLLAEIGVQRREFVSPSGAHSHFTGEPELYAALLAAWSDGQRLVEALIARGRRARGVLGHRGILRGERKKAIRYKEQGALRVRKDDLSGKVTEVDVAAIDSHLRDVDVLVIGAMLLDAEAGPVVCDADAVASAVAVAARAARYTVLTDVDGFLVDGAVLGEVALASMEALLPHARGGMSKKLRYIASSLEGGVGEVHLRNAFVAQGSPEPRGTRFHATDRRPDQ